MERTVLHRQRFLEGPLGEGYDVVVCDRCGCGFADGIPPQVDLDQYYAEQSKYTYDHRDGMESAWDFKRFETTVAHLAPFLGSRDARILDVGCATGGLLSVFKNAGFANVAGIDPSPKCAETAERLHGVKVTPSKISDLGSQPERFDLVLLLGVLEHISDARNAVRSVRSILNKGGMLYCAVPDVEGLVGCANAPFQQFSFEHVNFFSTASLDNLLRAEGMAAVKNWRWTTEWREGVMEPVASGLYALSVAADPPYDPTTEPALKAYLDDSKGNDRALNAQIKRYTDNQEPILVWGAGTLTRRLLADSSLADANIVAFVDSNRGLTGSMLAGRPVITPSQLLSRSETILICSQAFEMEIRSTIQDLGLQNSVQSLCGSRAS